MIRRSRGSKYAATPGSTGNDTDALQTDVMRFMSILGLCLMAVFALVQSIPLQDTGRSRPELEQLRQAIQSQQERARALQADLEHLTVEIRSAQERRTRAQQAVLSAQEQLTQLVDQTQQARRARDRVAAELEDLQRRVARGRDELAAIQQAARNETQALRELERRLGKQRLELDDIDQRASALADGPALTQAAPAAAAPPPPEPAAAKQGFSLRFESAEALARLVASGSVSLYAMKGKQAWRLWLDGGDPVFGPAAFPRWYHEMAPATVPLDYLTTLERSVGGTAASSVVWGVQLPSATRQGIASLTRGLPGGDLVIGADARVRLEPE